MNTITINGGNPLFGQIDVSGSKNAVLPILAACILTDQAVTIHNAPLISDIDDMLCIMNDLGISSERQGHTLTVDSSNINNYVISNEHVGRIRSSVVLLGAVIARFRKAKLAHPGGCDIGARPIDMHLDAFARLGINISYEDDCWCCTADELVGAHIPLPFPSVGATENVILAAAMAKGTTTIHNAAREPEITALQDMINLMGGQVHGAGTDTITIVGKEHYHGCEYTVIPDRIVAGTYMLATCATGGDVVINNAVRSHNTALFDRMEQMGADITYPNADTVRIRRTARLKPISLTQTRPFPGFPTDLQPQLMATLALANGKSVIRENIYESRFKAAFSLCDMGAHISIKVPDSQDSYAVIRGVSRLCGTHIYGTDLRCNAALVIAGLAAEGTTVLHKAQFIDRGYEDITAAFRQLGADITRST